MARKRGHGPREVEERYAREGFTAKSFREERMDPIKRDYEQALGKGIPREETDPEAVKKYPNLWAGFTRRDLPNGYVREPYQISVKPSLAGCVAVVRDNTLKQSLTVASRTLDGLWAAIEAVLAAPLPPWVPMAGKDINPRKRKNMDS